MCSCFLTSGGVVSLRIVFLHCLQCAKSLHTRYKTLNTRSQWKYIPCPSKCLLVRDFVIYLTTWCMCEWNRSVTVGWFDVCAVVFNVIYGCYMFSAFATAHQYCKGPFPLSCYDKVMQCCLCQIIRVTLWRTNGILYPARSESKASAFSMLLLLSAILFNGVCALL